MRFVAIALITACVGLSCVGQIKASRPTQSGPAKKVMDAATA